LQNALNDGSTGDEFGCAPARRFDGAARPLPTPARAKIATFASGDAARLLLGSSSYAKMAMGSVAQ